MPVISVRIPQLGEGLQEALLVEFLKKPGDSVKRDEPIYVMETDKATTDVESPYEGKLIEWTVEPGTVLQIGSEIGRMEVAEGVKEMPSGHGPSSTGAAGSGPTAAPASSSSSSGPSSGGTATATATPPRSSTATSVQIPPRTRKYLKDKGLLDVAEQIPAVGSKLMPEDVDRYLAAAQQPASTSGEDFDQVSLPQSQITLNYRLSRGAQVCVPVTVMTEMDWTRIERARQSAKANNGPTGFAMCCWCVVQSLKKHDRFRSVLTSDGRALKVFRHVNLGIAVALPGDEMVTAVVKHADQMSANEFFQAVARQIDKARDGKDQADESTTITISNIGKASMRMGIPAIVAPAVATLAIGEVYDRPVLDNGNWKAIRSVAATMSFDHRIVNGVGAGNFLNDVKAAVESFSLEA